MNSVKKLILLPEIIQEIKTDKNLFIKVSDAMGLSIGTLRNKLYKFPDHQDFTAASVLQVVREHLVLTDEAYEDKVLVMEAPTETVK